MDFPLGEWHDGLRVVIGVVCVITLWRLIDRFRKANDGWNGKTHDLWFSLVMWTLAGAIGATQGVYLDYPFGPALVFTTLAALIGAKGVFKRGKWGGDDQA